MHLEYICPTHHDERQRAICSPLTFPVPGGPYSSKCGKLSLSINLVNMLTISSCATRSSSLAGRYFSTHGICMLSSGTVGCLLTLMVGLSSSVSIFAVSDMVVAAAWYSWLLDIGSSNDMEKARLGLVKRARQIFGFSKSRDHMMAQPSRYTLMKK